MVENGGKGGCQHMWQRKRSTRKSTKILLHVVTSGLDAAPAHPASSLRLPVPQPRRCQSSSPCPTASIRATKTQIVALSAASSSVCHTQPSPSSPADSASSTRGFSMRPSWHRAFHLPFSQLTPFLLFLFLFYFGAFLQIFCQHSINHKSAAREHVV